jgi:hypothetical protein
MFKIQIRCDTDDLKFNGNIIDKRQYNYIRSRLQLKNIDYIDKMLILYKTDSEEIETVTIEFLTNREINENEFILFIVKMKDAGFVSLDETDIKFIDTTDITFYRTIYKRNFTSILRTRIRNRRRDDYRNKSTYKTGVIYNKNNDMFNFI